MATTTNICRLLDALPSSNNQLSVLQELKLVIQSVHPSVLKDVIPNISFHSVFDCLNTPNSEQLEVCCDVLNRLLLGLSPASVFHNFQDEIIGGLSHQLKPVRLLALSMLIQSVEDCVGDVSQCPDLLLATVQLLGDQHLDVAKQANIALLKIGGHLEGVYALYQGAVFNQLQNVLQRDDTCKYRVFQLVVDISKLSPLGLERSSQSGLLTQLVNDVYKDDILVQLNCLELLTDLASIQHGLLYLDQQGIVGTLESMMRKVEDDPMMGFLLPGLVKFFGNVARIHPKEVFEKYPSFISLVFRLLSSNDITHRSVAVETLGFVGGPMEGKQALEKLGHSVNDALRQLGMIIRDSPSELREKALNTFAALIQLEVEYQATELLALTEAWFQTVAPKPFELFMSISRQPFQELRCATHRIYRSVALQEWGQKLMNSHPGFNEYLLDHSTEMEKEGKEIKFEIVQTLVDSSTTRDVFGNPFWVKLKEYHGQGPFYIKAQAEVAIDGSN